MENTENIKNKKIKLDFKDSNYATGNVKRRLQEFGLKRVLERFT